MIALVVSVKAKPGQRDGLKSAALRMAEAVSANEPGNTLFTLGDGADADSIVIIERYVDEQAMADHRGMPHFKEMGREMGRFMDGPPQVICKFTEATA